MSRFARNSTFSALAGVSASAGNFLCTIVVARLLGVELAGDVAFAIWIASTIATVSNLGLPATLARYLPELETSGSPAEAHALTWWLAKFYVTAYVVTVSGLGAILWALHSDTVSSALGLPSQITQQNLGYVLIIGCLYTGQLWGQFASGWLQGFQNFGKIYLITISSNLAQLAAVGLGSYLFGATGALIGYTIGAAILALPLLFLGRKADPIDRRLSKRVFRYAAFAWAAGITNAFVWSRVEVVFLKNFWSSEQVSYFVAALAISNIAAQGPILLTGGLLPHFSSLKAVSEERLSATYAAATRLIAFLVLPACLGAAAVMPMLLPLLYGQAFSPAVRAAEILVSASAIGAVGAVGAQLLSGIERSDTIFYISFFGMVASTISGFTLIRYFGIDGAAFGRASIQIAMVLIGVLYTTRYARCRFPWASVGKLFLCAVVTALAARLVLTLWPQEPALFVAILTGVATYLVMVRVSGAMPQSDLEWLRRITDKLPSVFRRFAYMTLGFISSH